MKKYDTFSARTRTELMHVSIKTKDEADCELSSLFLCAGRPEIKKDEMPYYYFTRKREMIDLFSHLVKKSGGTPFFEAVGSDTVSGWKFIPLPSGEFDLPVLLYTYLSDETQDRVTSREDQRRAALRGAFLACGTLCDPQKEYRMEFSIKNPAVRRYVTLLLHGENIEPLVSKRKNRTVLYIKDAESILKFLALSGAHTAYLHLESIRVEKDMRGRVHRVVNCDSANTRRQAEAGARQIQWLERLLAEPAFASLSDDLKETAKVRVDNPGLSLLEAGKMLSVPVSKSGMNHRIKKLQEIAKDLKILE